MPVVYERGYLIPAVNNEQTDYVACAVQLAQSIRDWHPNARICLLTNIDCEDPVFDIVRQLPYGDTATEAWKLSNDWQVFQASPFRQTIKLEADMIVASPIDHWWTMLEHRDMVISTGARDFYNRLATSRRYRKLFDANNLPDVYNAVTYWRVSKTAMEFFNLVQQIFTHWAEFKKLLMMPDEVPTTDVVYAMAAVIIGPERVILPPGMSPTIVHMKKDLVGLQSPDWTRELVWENTQPGLRIHTVAQVGFVHYHVKEWRMQ